MTPACGRLRASARVYSPTPATQFNQHRPLPEAALEPPRRFLSPVDDIGHRLECGEPTQLLAGHEKKLSAVSCWLPAGGPHNHEYAANRAAKVTERPRPGWPQESSGRPLSYVRGSAGMTPAVIGDLRLAAGDQQLIAS